MSFSGQNYLEGKILALLRSFPQHLLDSHSPQLENIYFYLNYSLLFVLLQLYQFPPFAPLPSAPPPNYSLIKMKFHKFNIFQIFNGHFTRQ